MPNLQNDSNDNGIDVVLNNVPAFSFDAGGTNFQFNCFNNAIAFGSSNTQVGNTADVYLSRAQSGILNVSGSSALGSTGIIQASQHFATTGTISASTPGIDVTQTWNNVATSFRGIRSNITNTASATSSRLIDLQIGGTSQFNVDVVGNVVANATGVALATGATNGFLYTAACAGVPSGIPALLPTGAVPLIVDSTNKNLYFYAGGAWNQAGGGVTPTLGAVVNAGNIVNSVGVSKNITWTTGGTYAAGSTSQIYGNTDGTFFVSAGTPAGTGAGQALTLTSGSPNTTGAGAALNITASAGIGSNSGGGSVSLTPGNAVGSGTAGSFTCTAGQPVTGTAGAITLQAGLGGSTSGAGGIFTIKGGNVTTASSSGSGGAVNITGGTPNAGVTTTGAGGNVTITGGQGGSTSGVGGSVNLRGGNGGAGGGAVTILGGLLTTGAPGLSYFYGATASSSAAGGGLDIGAGSGFGAGSAGTFSINLTGGAGPASAGATGNADTGVGSGAASVQIIGASGGASSGNAGNIFIGGGVAVSGQGGSVTLTASNGVGTNKAGGQVNLTGGNATGAAVGSGRIYLITGFNQANNTQSALLLNGADNTTGGDASLNAGASTNGGNITVNAGAGTTTGGNVTIYQGIGSTTNGSITIGGTSANYNSNTATSLVLNVGTSTSPGSVVLGGGSGQGTNSSGTNFQILATLGTGNAQSGNFQVQTGFIKATGTTAQVIGDRFFVSGKITTMSTTTATATNFVNITLPTNNTSGGCDITYCVEANDGTNWNTAVGSFAVAASNKAGTVTATTSAITDEATNNNSGTFTAGTTSATISGTNVQIKCAPAWTVIVPTVVRISYTVVAFGNGVTVTPQ